MRAAVYIWKYRASENYAYTNYFLRPELADKIRIERIPEDGLPIYNEELEKRDGVLEFTAGDLDLKLSLLDKTTSRNGDSIKDFILPQNERSFMYLCMLELGEAEDVNAKRFAGRIELNSIEADLEEKDDKYCIRLKVTGLIKELAELQERNRLQPLYESVTIDDFISGCLVPDNAPPYLAVYNRLYWDEKTGFEPKLMWEVYNDVISRGIGKGKWSVFKELVMGFGFMFRLKVVERANIFDNDYPEVAIETFWRSRGLEQRDVKIKSVVERYSDLNSYKNYLIVTYRSNVLGQSGHYAGMLKDNRGNSWIADNYAGSVFEEMIFDDQSGAVTIAVEGGTPPVIAADAATVIHLPAYETSIYFITEQGSNLISAKVSFAALFCREYEYYQVPAAKWVVIHSFKNLMAMTVDFEYKYLISGLMNVKKWETYLQDNSNVNVFDFSIVDNIKFLFNSIRITNIRSGLIKLDLSEC